MLFYLGDDFIKIGYKYAISGALAGAINGLLGAGGGILLVPLLHRFIGLEERPAFATSVFIILPITLVTAIVYYSTGRIDLHLAWPYLLGGFFGGILAGRLFKKMSVIWLKRLFGAVLIIGGARALFI